MRTVTSQMSGFGTRVGEVWSLRGLPPCHLRTPLFATVVPESGERSFSISTLMGAMLERRDTRRVATANSATDSGACGITLCMKAIRTLPRLTCATILLVGISAAIPTLHEGPSALLPAQPPSGDPGSVELEQFLFVQAPEHDTGKGGIVVVWLPPPLQKLCLGKTATQCASIDYCIRTTNRDSSQCKNIGVNLTRIPPYPRGTRPSRMQSVVLMYLEPTKFEQLQDFYKSAPKATLERISMSARVKARIRYIRKPNDDGFELLEVLAVPPF